MLQPLQATSVNTCGIATRFQNLAQLLKNYQEKNYYPDLFMSLETGNQHYIYASNKAYMKRSFKGASILKTIIALLCVKVYRAEKWNWETCIEDIFATQQYESLSKLKKQLPIALYKTTIGALLNHKSGLKSRQELPIYQRKFVLCKRKKLPLLWGVRNAYDSSQVGKFCYCNLNYIILGILLEGVYQTPLANVLQKQIFKPIDMKDSYYYHEDIPQACLAGKTRLMPGYVPFNLLNAALFSDCIAHHCTKWIDVTHAYHPSWDDGGASGLITTIKDLERLASYIFKKNNINFFGRQNLFICDKTFTNKDWFPGLKLTYQMGFWKVAFPGNYMAWMLYGDQWGYKSGVLYFPTQKGLQDDVILVYATNTDNFFLQGFSNEKGFLYHVCNHLLRSKKMDEDNYKKLSKL